MNQDTQNPLTQKTLGTQKTIRLHTLLLIGFLSLNINGCNKGGGGETSETPSNAPQNLPQNPSNPQNPRPPGTPVATGGSGAPGTSPGRPQFPTPINNPSPHTTDFKISVAKALLSRSYSGRMYLSQIMGHNPYRRPIQVVGLNYDQMMCHGLQYDGGGVRHSRQSHLPVIVVNIDRGRGGTPITTSDIAHIMAHEMRHVLDEYDVEKFLSIHSPHLASEFRQLTHTLLKGTPVPTNISQTTIDKFFSIVFCTESRSYSRNFKLLREGLPWSNRDAQRTTLENYVERAYINKFNFQIQRDQHGHRTQGFHAIKMACHQYSHFYDYVNYIVRRHEFRDSIFAPTSNQSNSSPLPPLLPLNQIHQDSSAPHAHPHPQPAGRNCGSPLDKLL